MKWYWITLIVVLAVIVGFAVSRANMKAQFRKKAALGLAKLKQRQDEIDAELSNTVGGMASDARVSLSNKLNAIKSVISSNNVIDWYNYYNLTTGGTNNCSGCGAPPSGYVCCGKDSSGNCIYYKECFGVPASL